MIITEILARNARMYGDEIALIERDEVNGTRRSITWNEFDSISSRIANALISRGVKKGDKIIHLMINSLEWLPIYFGILRTGAWAVPLNFRFMSKEILHCAQIAEAKAFFFGKEFIDRVEKIKDDLKTIE
ncbi:MAG: acyl--CoA ligase, partial [Deltaproteobacteria bacterium]|nr:acyl--CoA ligase [Deltaproteobacteria bacterium]